MSPLELDRFLAASLTPWHAVAELEKALEEGGARRLDERAPFKLRPGELAYVVRNRSALAVVRAATGPMQSAFAVAAAHTDSPGLRLRNAGAQVDGAFLVLPTEIYGSPIVSTWLDRPLRITGLAMVRSPQGMEPRLVALDPFRAVVPNAAIHLNRDINKGFEYNPHVHLRALLPLGSFTVTRGRELESLVEQAQGWEAGSVVQAELILADAQDPVWLDPAKTVIQSPRLDNLAGCHAVLRGFLDTVPSADTHQVALFFDHEEIGSTSRGGATSDFLGSFLRRVDLSLGIDGEAHLCHLAASRILSVDAAHAVHPLYPEKHDRDYAPIMGHGLVLKANVNHKYATDLFSRSVAEALWARQGIAVQQFKNRADMGCGSTIGPIAEANSGISTLDVGIPILAMHSLRETGHRYDQDQMILAVSTFLGGEA